MPTSTGGEASGSDLTDLWRPLATDPGLSRPVTPMGPANVPVAGQLRLDIGWDAFEQLIAAIARDVLGLEQLRFRRYGRPGQAQHGIDLAGRRPGASYTVIQCKELKSFTARNLRAAVKKFTEGRRPFRATHFVVAVSHDNARSTQVQDALGALQQTHLGKLDIELWGPDEINEVLRDRGDIVGRFWSRETAAAFCTGAPLPGVAAPPPEWMRVADQVLFGPLEVDGLDSKVAAADRVLESHPTQAADAYGEIAHALAADGFTGHAHLMWRRQLSALHAAGDLPAAASLAARLAVLALHRGDVHQAQRLHHDLKELFRSAGSGASKDAELIKAAIEASSHPLGDPSAVVAALTEAADDDAGVPAYFSMLVLYVAELDAANEPTRAYLGPQAETSQASLLELVRRAIAHLEPSTAFDPTGDLRRRLRLTLCRLDATESARMLAEARQVRLPRSVSALVVASQARREALDGSADNALEHWRHAVSHAIHEGRTEDAAGWLYAIRNLNIRYGPWTDRLDEEHHLAQALPRSSVGGILGRVRDHESDARRAALNSRPIEAVLATRRWLADSIVSGSWADEDAAVELLGDLYAANAEGDRAALYYQWAGETKKLLELVRAAGDHALPVVSIAQGPWWRQVSALALVEAQQDLLDDDSARELLPMLLDLVAAGRVGELVEGPTRALTLQATRTMCVLAGRGRRQHAQQVLDMLADDVPRSENHHRHHDEQHVQACLDIASEHPELANVALHRLFDLAAAGTDDALSMLPSSRTLDWIQDPESGAGSSLSAEEREHLLERLRKLADAGRYNAVVALAAMGDRSPLVLEPAEQARDRILSRPEPDGHTFSFGTRLVTDAYLVTCLAGSDRTACVDKLMTIAEDRREAAQNRQDALRAAGNLIDEQSDQERTRVHLQSRQFVEGHADGSALDADVTRPHPLSAFKVSFGSASLRPDGLRLARASATSNEHISWTRDRALALLGETDDEDVVAAAVVLASLPQAVLLELDPRLLAAHRLPIVRRLAAFIGGTRPGIHPQVLRDLASDRDRFVRLDLVRRLSEVQEVRTAEDIATADSILTILQSDPRRSIRCEAASGARTSDIV